MKRLSIISVACVVALVTQIGCAGHRVRFQAIVKHRIPPTDHAVLTTGNFDEAKAIFEKTQLPHNSPRQRYELMLQGLAKLTDQLGSPDYVLIGEVFGGGNAWANQDTLGKALCAKAARNGGDVVMVISREALEQPFVYSTPGYSSTNATVNAYGYGNYATAYGTSHTTYTPGTTYSGVMHKPQANGFVFKHVPGIDAERRKILEANDVALTLIIAELDNLSRTKGLTWEQAQTRWREVAKRAIE